MDKLTYDLAIVGGGILGAMAAYHACLQGRRVILLESGNKPNHATVRNFGSIVPSGQAVGEWRALGLRSLAIYQDLHTQLGLPLRRQGSLYIAHDDQEAQLLHEMHAVDKEHGFSSNLCTQKQASLLQRTINANAISAGLHYPDEVSVDSPKFMALFNQFIGKNPLLDIVYQSEVLDVGGHKGHFQVVVENGSTIFSDQVLLCCGHLHKSFMKPFFHGESVRLCKLQMMMTRPLYRQQIKGNVFGGLSIRRYNAFSSCSSYSALETTAYQEKLQDLGIHLMFKQAATGEIIVGDSHQYFDLTESHSLDYYMDAETNRLMLDEANRMLKIQTCDIKKQWIGWYLEHESGALLKSLEPGLHAVTGLGGKGMTVGPALMEKAIQRIFSEYIL